MPAAWRMAINAGSMRSKEGEGALVGNAGEFDGVAERLKRGVSPALALQDSQSFDTQSGVDLSGGLCFIVTNNGRLR